MRKPDMQRATTLLMIRKADEDAREISGIASTPTPDRYGDVIESAGAVFSTPLPLLWMHDHTKAIGSVTLGAASTAGVAFAARIAKIDAAGPLKDRVDEAWQSIKTGLLRAVSIGFRPLESEPMKSGGTRFTKWEWLELSLVTIPANPDALITDSREFEPDYVRAFLAEARARQPRLKHAPTPVVRLK